ncbi:hypothetical protein JXJ21_09870 [candidate division KSB1 bacterium]|nr:hypothetical protein [candidate division KSB1 bacterium]
MPSGTVWAKLTPAIAEITIDIDVISWYIINGFLKTDSEYVFARNVIN